MVYFQYKMLVVSAKSNLGCAAGCGLTGSCSDHGRIMLESYMVGSFSDDSGSPTDSDLNLQQVRKSS